MNFWRGHCAHWIKMLMKKQSSCNKFWKILELASHSVLPSLRSHCKFWLLKWTCMFYGESVEGLNIINMSTCWSTPCPSKCMFFHFHRIFLHLSAYTGKLRMFPFFCSRMLVGWLTLKEIIPNIKPTWHKNCQKKVTLHKTRYMLYK